jgi:hypothetical protein
MSESKELSAVVVLAPASSSLYKSFSSYSELRKDRVKEEAKQEIRQKNDSVFGLEWVGDQDEGNDASFLVGCTGSGDLVVWKVGASNTKDSAKPILR